MILSPSKRRGGLMTENERPIRLGGGQPGRRRLRPGVAWHPASRGGYWQKAWYTGRRIWQNWQAIIVALATTPAWTPLFGRKQPDW
jgi:hypothetical protein